MKNKPWIIELYDFVLTKNRLWFLPTILFLLLLSFASFVSAISTNPLDYNLSDGVDTSDTTINNSLAINKMRVNNGGWSVNVDSLDEVMYSNGRKSLGSVAINVTNAGSNPIFSYNFNDDTYKGLIGYKMYIPTGCIGGAGGYFKLTKSSNYWFGYYGYYSGTNYVCNAGASGTALIMDNWFNVTWNITSTGIQVLVNNGLVCNNAGGTLAGISRLDFSSDYDSGGCYGIDEFKISKNNTFSWPEGAPPDTSPPTLSNAICTSCISETNNTLDSTPTINVTCADCQMVRIANNSWYNFSNATSSRNCTTGSNNWICTLPTSDQLVDTTKNTTIYFWGNGTNGVSHNNFNLSINLTYVIDIQAPTFSNYQINVSGTNLTNKSVQTNITISDNYGLDTYIFSWYNGTNWNNDTDRLISGITYKSIINKTITIDSGTIYYLWYANDTFNNRNQSDTYSLTVESPLPAGILVYQVHSCYNLTKSDLGGCFAVNWTKAYNQINWSDNRTIKSGNYSWNFTQRNITVIGDYLFNFTNNGTTNITINIKLNQTNPNWVLRYNGTNITTTNFISLINLTTNTARKINLTLDLINISQSYVNWTLNRSTAEWGFNYTINAISY